ncbi:dehydrogenase/reductase SDR family member 11-like [Mytilus trossulus]|uniref:dehydrogenase/reductase SDR family member 11-like n=1 Tax=Mytilus trossulus TaxID=6551 RepID=UPI00300488BA
METWRNRVALVTGASMGIGYITCKNLAKHGIKVVGCARSAEKLKDLEEQIVENGGQFLPIICDLRKQDDIMEMFEMIKKRWGGVDICINNAGLSLDAPIINGDFSSWENMWQVNVMALCLCTRESVKMMRANGVDDGHIININSLSGHRCGKAHFYSATKHAVTALTEGIRWELREINSHIKITSISPGLVKTNFAYTAVGEAAAEECYSTRQSLDPQDIANAIETVLSYPSHVQVSEMMIRPTEQVV